MTALPTVVIRGRSYTVRPHGVGVHAYVLTGPRGAELDVYRVRSSPTGRMFARWASNGRQMAGVALYDRGGVVTAEVDE